MAIELVNRLPDGAAVVRDTEDGKVFVLASNRPFNEGMTRADVDAAKDASRTPAEDDPAYYGSEAGKAHDAAMEAQQNSTTSGGDGSNAHDGRD